MRKLSNGEAELKKSVAYKKRHVTLFWFYFHPASKKVMLEEGNLEGGAGKRGNLSLFRDDMRKIQF